MTQSEIDILLKAIGAVREDVQHLDSKFEEFRTYADLTYVRKDTLQSKQDSRETLWKARDRILARVAVLVSAASAAAVIVALFVHH